MVVGGAKQLLPSDQFSQMSGSKIVQKFGVSTKMWSREADLPAPIFEVFFHLTF